MSVNVELNNAMMMPTLHILIYGIFILPLISDTNSLSTLHIYIYAAIYSNYKVGWQML